VELFGQEVEAGTLADVALFWTDGEHRRAIVGSGYADTQATLERVLRRFPGGGGHYANLRAKLGELDRPGGVLGVVLGEHRFGLAIPYRAGLDGESPSVVCREQRALPASPVLCSSLEHTRSFARAASLATGLPQAGWRAFRGERLRSPIERLFARAADGHVVLRSELEEELAEARRRPSPVIARRAGTRAA
jgi:hypothetical protein